MYMKVDGAFRRCTLLLVVCLGIWGCKRAERSEAVDAEDAGKQPQPAWFVEEATRRGLDWQHDRGPVNHWIPEITGGGVAWIDYDMDGHLDLYVVQGGEGLRATHSTQSNRLFRNQGDGSFVDVTDNAGVGDTQYGMGAAVGDFNGDGLPDLYVTNVGPNRLYKNLGNGSFQEMAAEAGVDHPGWGTAAAFVDYDQDGDEDLLLINYLVWSPDKEIDCRTGDNQRDYCAPAAYQAPAPDVLYRNRGDGTFEDVSRDAGLGAAYGNGLGAVVADLNGDGRIDFYVANDGNPNQLWIQDANGKFQDQSLLLGCSVNRFGVAEAGMGVAAIDLENDGDLDLFMTHLAKETNTLYINEGGFFEDRTAQAKLAEPSVSYTGFGLGFADLDNDGQVDLYVANGRVARYAEELVPGNIFAEPNQLFRGIGAGVFEEQLPQGGTAPVLIENSRASAMADFDRDGDIDIVIINNGGPVQLLVNQIGQLNRWARFRVRHADGRDAVAARVGITIGGMTQWRLVARCYGYLSSNEPEVHFGLGLRTALSAGRLDSVRVIWPDGREESFGSQPIDTVIELREGQGEMRPR
jgi:hypothetical protein